MLKAGWGVLLLLLTLLPMQVWSRQIDIYPKDSFEKAVERLKPGDTLRVHAGEYRDNGKIVITVKGSADKPVRIIGLGEPHITRSPDSNTQNTINIEGASHLTLKGLQISSNGGDGVRLRNASYITLQDLYIHHVDVGINFRTDMHHIVARNNYIHDTGAGGKGTGEGFYVGCNHAKCRVWDSVIEGNWIHNTFNSTQGDGIEIKAGSYHNIVRDNVIYNTRYPCVLVYSAGGRTVNRVERNVMWNCGDSAIQAAADAIIENNIVLPGPGVAFNSIDHQGIAPNNLRVVHNTFVGGRPCLNIAKWKNKSITFSNNAIYCERALYRVTSLDGVRMEGNVFHPSPAGLFPNGSYVRGNGVREDLVWGKGRNVYPTPDSALIGAGKSHLSRFDFNGQPRQGRVVSGAYHWSGKKNPGWEIKPGFKPIVSNR